MSDEPIEDREIVVSRVVAASPALVFEALSDAAHLGQWWGPDGFTTTTRSFAFAEGGSWDFVMHGPDGTDFPNWITWLEIVPNERIVFIHGESATDSDAFESTITLTAAGNGTEVTLRTLFQTAEHRRRAAEEYHAVDGALQTLGRLADFIESGGLP